MARALRIELRELFICNGKSDRGREYFLEIQKQGTLKEIPRYFRHRLYSHFSK
jgi:hypothetical protein